MFTFKPLETLWGQATADLKHLTESEAISRLFCLKQQNSASNMSRCELAVTHLAMWAAVLQWSVRNTNRATNQTLTLACAPHAAKHLGCSSKVKQQNFPRECSDCWIDPFESESFVPVHRIVGADHFHVRQRAGKSRSGVNLAVLSVCLPEVCHVK